MKNQVNIYLKEEIQAEGIVKKLPAFSQFLQTDSTTSGEVLNFTSISNETGVKNTLSGTRDFTEKTDLWGKFFRKTLVRK